MPESSCGSTRSPACGPCFVPGGRDTCMGLGCGVAWRGVVRKERGLDWGRLFLVSVGNSHSHPPAPAAPASPLRRTHRPTQPLLTHTRPNRRAGGRPASTTRPTPCTHHPKPVHSAPLAPLGPPNIIPAWGPASVARLIFTYTHALPPRGAPGPNTTTKPRPPSSRPGNGNGRRRAPSRVRTRLLDDDLVLPMADGWRLLLLLAARTAWRLGAFGVCCAWACCCS